MPYVPQSGPLSFGYQRSPDHVHQGVDIPAPEGTPLYAPVSGTVKQASAELERGFSGYGGHVVIFDGAQWWLFAHLASVSVSPGQQIVKGQQIGTVGRTCYSNENPAALCDGAHVHLEVSPRPYPQDSEAARVDPGPAIDAAGGADALFRAGNYLDTYTSFSELDRGLQREHGLRVFAFFGLAVLGLALLQRSRRTR